MEKNDEVMIQNEMPIKKEIHDYICGISETGNQTETEYVHKKNIENEKGEKRNFTRKKERRKKFAQNVQISVKFMIQRKIFMIDS